MLQIVKPSRERVYVTPDTCVCGEELQYCLMEISGGIDPVTEDLWSEL